MTETVLAEAVVEEVAELAELDEATELEVCDDSVLRLLADDVWDEGEEGRFMEVAMMNPNMIMTDRITAVV